MMYLRSFILGLLLMLSPALAWAGPWSLGAEAGPMLWLLKQAPVSYAMNLSPAYAITDALMLEGVVGLRHYSSETEFTENATTSLPLMIGGRYVYKLDAAPVSLVSGLSVGGFVLVEADRVQEETQQTMRFEAAGRLFLGADFHLLENFSFGLNTVLEMTPKNLFLTFGLGGRVHF
jgi:hypothetical protein